MPTISHLVGLFSSKNGTSLGLRFSQIMKVERVFFINTYSDHLSLGKELLLNPNCAMTFYWNQRQIRIEGKAEKSSDDINDQYFSSRYSLATCIIFFIISIHTPILDLNIIIDQLDLRSGLGYQGNRLFCQIEKLLTEKSKK